MTVRFLLGNATTSKSARCVNEIKEKLINQPQGRPIIYLVPDQMTFQLEYKLLQDQSIDGSIRAQVLSFSRLALRVLQERGGATKPFISSTGIQMILRKIMEERKTGWQVFQKSIEKKGFIAQMEAMITEFKRYCISPEQLIGQVDQLGQSLNNKLNDLHYIYDKLSTVLADQYIDGEDRLALLSKKLHQSKLLEGAEVYIDGFHRFTPQEQQVIAALLDSVQHVTFALTVDPDNLEQLTAFDLFSQTKQTYQELKALVEEKGLSFKNEIVKEENVNAHLTHLEYYFDQRPAPKFQQKAPLQIAQAVHPRAEVEGAAQEILRLVREEQYRYQDIAILIRETDVYHDLIETIFKDYNIPIFIDEKRTMLHHPLIELIRSAFDVVLGNWRYDAIFRLLKTGLIPMGNEKDKLDQDAIDTLENYVLEYGIRGRKQWVSEKPWIFQRFKGFDKAVQTDEERKMQTKINHYRSQVVSAVAPFDKMIREATTVKEKATALYTWLEHLNIGEQLEQRQINLDQAGEIEHAREQEQVWNAIIQLLDEMVELIGAQELSIQLFQQSIETGFEALKFAHVPPSMDHVVIGTIDRSRLSEVKAALLLGVNEGTWPMKPQIDGVLTEEERLHLQQQGIDLADGEKQQLVDDWFYIYLAVTVAKDYMWISYPLSDSEGKAKIPASLIKRMTALFPDNRDILLLQDPEEMVEADRFVTTPNKTLSALTAQLAKYQRAYPIDSVWWSVFNWFITNETSESKTSHILESLFYENKPTTLSEDTTEQLYPKAIKASVSRLEMFHRCSYQHFAQYSLGLQERRTYKLDAPDIGQLFHEALKQITEWIQKEGRTFNDINQKDANTYAARAIDELAPILQHQILHSSNRYQYMKQKLEQIIARATYVLSEQSRKSHFAPIGLELGFGLPHSELDPINLTLPNGYQLILRGRIDRVDQARIEDELYLRIIDYKSSAKGLDLVEVYYGLALQMLAYLDVILSNSEKWLGVKATPAGVLYFHVHDPILSESKALNPATIEEKLFKKYKMQGLLIEDEHVVQMMDTELETGMSPIIPAGLKKDGTFRSGSQIAPRETFSQLQSYVRNVIVQAGVNITEGSVDLNPYQKGQQTACDFCSFRSVCQFDSTLPENNYRQLQPLKDDQIVSKLFNEEGE